jgi:hypothetical protein
MPSRIGHAFDGCLSIIQQGFYKHASSFRIPDMNLQSSNWGLSAEMFVNYRQILFISLISEPFLQVINSSAFQSKPLSQELA